MIRYQIANRLRMLFPYAVQVERPRSKIEHPILVPTLKSRFVNHGHNSLNFEEGELIITLYGTNDGELIKIGQQLLDQPLSFAGVSITKKSRLSLNATQQSTGTITFGITINSDITWEDENEE